MPQPRKALPLAAVPGDAALAAGDGEGQSHPLYSADRSTVDRLLAAETPQADDLVDAARLLSRYGSFPGAFDLQEDLRKAIRHWGLTPETLRERTRALWQGGYRMGANDQRAEPVGSGFDASADGEA